MAENKEIVRQVIEGAYNQGKLDALDGCCADHYVMHEAFGRDLNREGEKKLVQSYRGAFPDLHIESDTLIEEGNYVCARWTATGTHQRALFGIAPSGEKLKIDGLLLVRCEQGRAAEAWQVFGTLRFVQQMRQAAGGQASRREGGTQPSPH